MAGVCDQYILVSVVNCRLKTTFIQQAKLKCKIKNPRITFLNVLPFNLLKLYDARVSASLNWKILHEKMKTFHIIKEICA